MTGSKKTVVKAGTPLALSDNSASPLEIAGVGVDEKQPRASARVKVTPKPRAAANSPTAGKKRKSGGAKGKRKVPKKKSTAVRPPDGLDNGNKTDDGDDGDETNTDNEGDDDDDYDDDDDEVGDGVVEEEGGDSDVEFLQVKTKKPARMSTTRVISAKDGKARRRKQTEADKPKQEEESLASIIKLIKKQAETAAAATEKQEKHFAKLRRDLVRKAAAKELTSPRNKRIHSQLMAIIVLLDANAALEDVRALVDLLAKNIAEYDASQDWQAAEKDLVDAAALKFPAHATELTALLRIAAPASSPRATVATARRKPTSRPRQPYPVVDGQSYYHAPAPVMQVQQPAPQAMYQQQGYQQPRQRFAMGARTASAPLAQATGLRIGHVGQTSAYCTYCTGGGKLKPKQCAFLKANPTAESFGDVL